MVPVPVCFRVGRGYRLIGFLTLAWTSHQVLPFLFGGVEGLGISPPENTASKSLYVSRSAVAAVAAATAERETRNSQEGTLTAGLPTDRDRCRTAFPNPW